MNNATGAERPPLVTIISIAVTLFVGALGQQFLLNQPGQAQWTAFLAILLFLLPQAATVLKGSQSTGRRQINLLAILAILAAAAQEDFMTGAFIAALITLSLRLERKSAGGARRSVEALLKLKPTTARLIESDGIQTVPATHLVPGQKVQVRPGDLFPADGQILEGFTTINEAPVTGESLPVEKSVGDEVFAGTANEHGLVTIQIIRTGTDTTLGQVQELIEQAEQSRTPLTRLIDQCTLYYTPLMLLTAAFVWLLTHDLTRISALLIAICPCALLLATPSASIAALTAVARARLLVKDLSLFESAAAIDTVIFDKTGTLTAGELKVSHLHPVDAVDPAELLTIAANAEQLSSHPAAKAVCKLAEEAAVDLSKVRGKEVPGLGVEAEYQAGELIRVGRPKWILEWCDLDATADAYQPQPGATAVFVAINQQLIGWIEMKDRLREDAPALIQRLLGQDRKTLAMVTGDNATAANEVGQQLGIEQIKAHCMPEDKVKVIRHFQENGYRVAFVGDGVNDAPALAAADCGFAMGTTGSEAALHSAAVNLLTDRIEQVAFFLSLARRTRTIIRFNLFMGLLVVLAGLYLSAAGVLSPTLAAICNTGSTLLVVFNSARLFRET